ncbi:hypothetical protein [Aliiglaciecola litoralis]|uniref:MSHA biogenesis protein MshK n=1 Tax=Aliiglaciecola litoralis TaxID=582857 RepID=A0ABP3WUD1_9ALTE
MGRKILVAVLLLATCNIQAQQLVDPTQPQGFTAGTSVKSDSTDTSNSTIVVSAVFIKGASKLAVLNGESVAEGQNWKGNTVKMIHKNGVVLVTQGRETELFINQNSIKKDASNDY